MVGSLRDRRSGGRAGRVGAPPGAGPSWRLNLKGTAPGQPNAALLCSVDVSLDADLAEFVVTRWPTLLRFGLLLTGNLADAEDLVQTALTRTAVRWPAMRNRDRPEAYVRQAMVRLHVNRWRSLLSRERLAAQVPDRAVPAGGIESLAVRQTMWAALATLPPRQRAVLVLRYYEDLSEAEIAQVLDCRPGTVKSQAAKALRSLRQVTGLVEDEPTATKEHRS
jgi:RNA polymerase sigma-70 factor (sigma-E family)